MNRTEIRDALFPNCPIRNILSRIGDKWSLLVLFTLETNSTQRFKELQRNIPDISQKMLTATLKTLEADGLVHREAFPRFHHVLSIRWLIKARVFCRILIVCFHGQWIIWTIFWSRESTTCLNESGSN